MSDDETKFGVPATKADCGEIVRGFGAAGLPLTERQVRRALLAGKYDVLDGNVVVLRIPQKARSQSEEDGA
jgi:hypothetical protein